MKKLFFIIAILLGIIKLQAQEPPKPVTIVSPNVASLGVFKDIPVSMYTGVPQISIPLYDLKSNGIALPISLSYNASGVQPDQHPGWVGTNWSLSAGGVVSRKVKGLPDETNHIGDCIGEFIIDRGGGTRSTVSMRGYYFNESLLQGNNWVLNSVNYCLKGFQSQYLDSLKNSSDQEPDEFSFVLPNGTSGKFYLNESKQWIVQCEKPVKLIFNDQFINPPFDYVISLPYYLRLYYYCLTGQTNSNSTPTDYIRAFKGFTIITEDGIKYEFGNSNESIEYSIDFFLQFTDQWVADSWYLTKIIHPNGNNIDLTYQRNKFICQMQLSMQKGYVLGGLLEADNNNTYRYHHDITTNLNDIEKNIGGKLIYPAYLSNIDSKNENISFDILTTNELRYTNRTFLANYEENTSLYAEGVFPFLQKIGSQFYGYIESINNLQWMKLDKIKVKDKSNNLIIKNINFYYNNNSNERLFLKQLELKDYQKKTDNIIAASNSGIYKFGYYKPSLLPKYLSNMTDSWGYYNGISASVSASSESYTNARNTVDAEKSRYGILTSITYPTGGCTKFLYENNEYSKEVLSERWDGLLSHTSDLTGGGLRIRKILKYDSDHYRAKPFDSTEYLYKNFTYQNYGPSSGIMSCQIKYNYDDFVCYRDNEAAQIRKFIVASQSVLPSSTGGVGHEICYSSVKEIKSDGSYSIYRYSNFDQGGANGEIRDELPDGVTTDLHIYLPYTSNAFKRGKIISQSEYNNNDILVHRKEITYLVLNQNYIRNLYYVYKASTFNSCVQGGAPPVGINYFEISAYKIYTSPYLPSIEREYFYDKNTGIQQVDLEKRYIYTDNGLLKSVNTVTKKSNNELDKKNNITEYRYPFEIQSDPYIEMTNSNMIGMPIETIHKVNTKIIGAELSIYENKFLKNFYKLNISQPLETFSYFDGTNVNPLYNIPILSIVAYHSQFKKIAQVQDNIGINTVYLWGYNWEYPVAEIKNITYQQVKNYLGEIKINQIGSSLVLSTEDINQLNNLRSQFPQAYVTTYSYKPLVGIETMIDARGIKTYYSYDGSGRLIDIYIIEKDASGNETKKVLKSYKYHYRTDNF